MSKKKTLTKEEKAAKNKKRVENYDPIRAARNALRREFSRSPVVIGLMNNPSTKRHVPKYNKDGTRAKVDSVEYLCEMCSKWKKSYKGNKVAVDHKNPVVDPKVGFVDIKVYYERMWCPVENLQVCCGECHRNKTNNERLEKSIREDGITIKHMMLCSDIALVKKVMKRFNKNRVDGYPKHIFDMVNHLKRKVGQKPIT